MSKMKTLLFRQEIRNRRVKKIKSKLFHKIRKRGRDRDEEKLLEDLDKIDPEAAQEYRDRQEQKRVEERIAMRHGANSKFAKKLKRFGGFENTHTKEAYNDMLKEKEKLKQKTRQTTA